MSLKPFFIVWILLALGVLVMYVWRSTVARNEDDELHVGHAEEPDARKAVAEQTALEMKLSQIEKWGKTLTIIAVAYGVVLFAAYMYLGWVQIP